MYQTLYVIQFLTGDQWKTKIVCWEKNTAIERLRMERRKLQHVRILAYEYLDKVEA